MSGQQSAEIERNPGKEYMFAIPICLFVLEAVSEGVFGNTAGGEERLRSGFL